LTTRERMEVRKRFTQNSKREIKKKKRWVAVSLSLKVG
jgi:hypothetical protein